MSNILFYGFLTLAIGTPILLAVRSWWSSGYNPIQWGFWLLACYFVRIQWRTRLPSEFPLAGEPRGAIVVSNHCSSIDPFFMQVLQKKAIHWMVAKEYCEHWLFGLFLRPCAVIPVNRGGVDTSATLAAIQYVQKGELIGMFPEGRINTSDDLMLPGRPGAILIALKARAPIIPCYIKGSPYGGTAWSPLVMRARAELICGKPIDLSAHYGKEKDHELVRSLLLDVMKEIAKLAGREDFEPQLAGRRWKKEDAEEEAEQEARVDGMEPEQEKTGGSDRPINTDTPPES